MPQRLQVVDGPAKGRALEVPPGRAVTVGRTNRSMLQFPEDEWMSGLHFVIASRNGSLHVANLSKTNGTEVNGARIEASALKAGDTIKAGQSVFSVMPAPAAPFPARFHVGGWGFEHAPEGWEFTEGFGFRHSAQEPFRASISAVEESLPNGQTLPTYVDVQMDLGRRHITGAEFKGPVDVRVQGVEAALALSLSAPVTGKGQAVQNQVYALHQGVVGVLTATALESQSRMLRDAMKVILKGLSFHQM